MRRLGAEGRAGILVPSFAGGATADAPGSLQLLARVLPLRPDPSAKCDVGEPPTPRRGGTYEALHRDLFDPLARAFDLVREISGLIQHEVGAFG